MDNIIPSGNIFGGYDDITPVPTDKTVFSLDEIENLDMFKDCKTPLAVLHKIDPGLRNYKKVKASIERVPGADMSDKRTDQVQLRKFKKPGCPEMYCAVASFELKKEDGTVIKFEKMIYTNVLVLEDGKDNDVSTMQMQKAIAGINSYCTMNFKKPLNPKSSQRPQIEAIMDISKHRFQYVTDKKGNIAEIIRLRQQTTNSRGTDQTIEGYKMKTSRHVFSVFDFFKGKKAKSKEERSENIKQAMKSKITRTQSYYKNILNTNHYQKGKVSLSDLGINETIIKGDESLERLNYHLNSYNELKTELGKKEQEVVDTKKEIKALEKQIKTLEKEKKEAAEELKGVQTKIYDLNVLRDTRELSDDQQDEFNMLEQQEGELRDKLEGDQNFDAQVEKNRAEIAIAQEKLTNLNDEIRQTTDMITRRERKITFRAEECFKAEQRKRLNRLKDDDSEDKYAELMTKMNKVGSHAKAYLDANFRVTVSPDLVDINLDQ